MNYTYIVKCADSTLYTGWTNDLDKRIKAHNSGKGAKYTKTRRPVKLVYYEEHETKNEAMSREYAIKHLSRKEKEILIKGNGNLCGSWMVKGDMIKAGESGGVYGGSGLTERDRRFLRNFPVFFSVLPISKYAEKSMNRG